MRATRLFHAIVIAGATIGCGSRSTAPMDAGRDAGRDGGLDAGLDAPFDAGFDAAVCGFGDEFIYCCFGLEDGGPDDPTQCCLGSATDPRCDGCELFTSCIL